jgi:Rieske Fe-S protein
MDRKEFLRLIGGSCLAIAGIAPFFSGCTSIHKVSTVISDNKLRLSKNEFTSDQGKPLEVVLVRAASLAFPIALYRINPEEYIALWMECTHKGCEVNAQTNYLICPCHGSEFDAKGNVVQGPAETNLKTFNITKDHENIYIHL